MEDKMGTIDFAKKYWDERVKTLLEQFSEYERIGKEYEEWKQVEREKPKLLSLGAGGWQNFGEPVNPKFEAKMHTIGVSMKFDNPYVWIKYKGIAYFDHHNPAKKMNTLEEFIQHMKMEETCPKRFAAVNRELAKQYAADLESGIVPREMLLADVADHHVIISLSLDPEFISLWCAHEYDAQGKWVKWNPHDEHGGAKRTRCC